MTEPRSTRADLSDRLARVTELPVIDPRKERRRASPAAPAPATAATQQPQASADPAYSERLSITTTRAQIDALRRARLGDGIQATARLRAMIDLWMRDPELRDRIDAAAADWAF